MVGCSCCKQKKMKLTGSSLLQMSFLFIGSTTKAPTSYFSRNEASSNRIDASVVNQMFQHYTSNSESEVSKMKLERKKRRRFWVETFKHSGP